MIDVALTSQMAAALCRLTTKAAPVFEWATSVWVTDQNQIWLGPFIADPGIVSPSWWNLMFGLIHKNYIVLWCKPRLPL